MPATLVTVGAGAGAEPGDGVASRDPTGDGAGVGVPDELLLPLSLLLHADTTAAAHSAMAPTLTRTERG